MTRARDLFRWMTAPRGAMLAMLAGALLAGPGSAAAQGSFVTFESGQVRPLALSPDGTRLFAVNTPDNRLESFLVAPFGLIHLHSVPVVRRVHREEAGAVRR